MGTGERIRDFIAAVREVRTAQEFMAAHGHPFLVQEATRLTGLPGDDLAAAAALPGGGARTTARIDRPAVPTGDGFAEADVWIQRVRSRGRRVGGRVTLGADATCDIVVDDASISGLHAQFEVPVDPEAEVFVSDEGSTNGTFVDGERIQPGRKVKLEDQVSLRFGPAVKFQYFSAEGFFQFLDFYRRIKR